MNAMQIAAQSSPTTIGELKKYLAELEAAWTEEDELFLGKLEDQALYIQEPSTGGIGYASFVLIAEHGLVAIERDILPGTY